MRIYIDFDHTISPNGLKALTQPPYASCVEAIQQLKQAGHTVVIFSCRASQEVVGSRMKQYVAEMEQYLQQHTIPYDSVFYGKPDYDVVIDDKALRFTDNWAQIARSFGIDV